MLVVRRLAFVVLFALVVTACSRPQAVVMAPVEKPVVTTSVVEEPVAVEAAAPPETAPPEAPEVAQDPVPAAARAARPAKAAPAARGKPQPTGHIEIPAIGLSHATYEGIELSVLNYGPGHWPGTAHPGEPGNTVFPGHRTTYTRPFWDIDRLVQGDHVIFTTPAGRFTYRVDQTLIVDDEDTWIITQTKDPTFTIFACHPKGSARQRYVVKGSLVKAAPTTTTTAPTTTTTTKPEEGLIPGFP